jgi:hypothetical protein
MTRSDTRWFFAQAALSLASLGVIVWACSALMKPSPPPLVVQVPAPVIQAPPPASIDRTTSYECGFLAGRAALAKELHLRGEELSASTECPPTPGGNGDLARK